MNEDYQEVGVIVYDAYGTPSGRRIIKEVTIGPRDKTPHVPLSLIEKAADVTFAKSNGVLQAAATYSGHPTRVYAVKIDVCLEVPTAMENGIGLAASRLQAFVNSVNSSLGRDTAELWLSSDNDVGRRDVTLCLRPDRIAEVGRLML